MDFGGFWRKRPKNYSKTMVIPENLKIIIEMTLSCWIHLQLLRKALRSRKDQKRSTTLGEESEMPWRLDQHEGRTIVENRTADIFQETRKLQIGRKPSNSNLQFQNPTDQETQLKVSRNVANAMAAKAKLLMRELKTVKADMAFTKERCSQLEDENKILRESRQKGDHNADDDLIRLQLETLLAEKARLAHENSIYARENRFLREIVEYHQLNMQDVVSLAGDDDDDIEEEVEEMLSSPVLSSPRSPTANSYQPSYPSPRTSVAAGSPTSSNSPRHDVLEKRQGDGEEEEEEVSLSPISKNSPTSLA
ncbi:uncharacterized protein [Typha angustifolia]|uniref:uncharacterized protein isoform X3 n=1 Tax=Typha angustifolia TaxID=59011 RepID=UPI003C2C24F0